MKDVDQARVPFLFNGSLSVQTLNPKRPSNAGNDIEAGNLLIARSKVGCYNARRLSLDIRNLITAGVLHSARSRCMLEAPYVFEKSSWFSP